MENDGEDLPAAACRATVHPSDLLRSKRSSLRFSEEFLDPIALLSAAEGMGLEGVVSKRRDQPYKSGESKGWIKVRTAAWRAANKDRWEQFQNTIA
jgi:bifunctional non-homologous end joining protein LigD